MRECSGKQITTPAFDHLIRTGARREGGVAASAIASLAAQGFGNSVLACCVGIGPETAITRHRVLALTDDVHRRVRQSGQHLLRTGEIELRKSGKMTKPTVKTDMQASSDAGAHCLIRSPRLRGREA